MNGSWFFDTNIFVYAFHPDDPFKSERARALLRNAAGGSAGVISYQVVQEFFSVAQRKFREPLRPEDETYCLDAVFLPLLAVESSLELVRAALRLQRQHRLAWYDALIVAAALQAQCGILYTEDLQHGQRFGDLLVQNPFLPAQ